METKDLVELLNRHPNLKARFEALLSIAENNSGEFELADDAESAVIEGVRRMGHEVLQTWAREQNNKKFEQAKEDKTLKQKVKKNCIG